jgi:hypothetical protein
MAKSREEGFTDMKVRLLENGEKLIEMPLETVSKSEFADLKNGLYRASFTDPNGHRAHIIVRVSASRAKLREVSFDLYGCSWNLLPEPVEAFKDQILVHLRSQPGRFKWADVNIPSGGGGPSGTCHLWFSIIRGEEGEWLYKAAQLLADPKSLKAVTFP